MDLNRALNLRNCNVNLSQYKDYIPRTALATTSGRPGAGSVSTDAGRADHQSRDSHLAELNDGMSSRIFDVNPTRIQYQTSSSSPQQNIDVAINGAPYWQTAPLGQPTGALPSSIGQSLLLDQSYFPTPIAQQQPQSEMSSTYLQMKQLQEQTTLSERGDANPLALERIKQEHATELQRNLQMQGRLASGPSGRDGLRTDFAQLGPTSSQGMVAYNVQGDTVNDRSTLYQDKKVNKYSHLKEMSPEMLNQMYGRQSDQSVLPDAKTGTVLGDIYEQTSCFKCPQNWPESGLGQLRQSLESRKAAILAQKSRQGIQSFSTVDSRISPLNEAYAPI